MSPYRTQLQGEFDFRREVLPVLLIAVLLNIVGRVGGSKIPGIEFLFLDQAGTVMSAILLGPWWAATAAIAGNIVNGNVFANYFPFGGTSVAIGVVLGYASRLARVRETLIDPDHASPHSVAAAWAGLTLMAAVAATAASLVVKVLLYEPMGRDLLFGKFYEHYMPLVREIIGTGHAKVFELGVADLVRETMDKGLTVAIGMVFAMAIGFGAPAITQLASSDRIKTDALSIFVFALLYGLYLLAARLAVPEIKLTGAVRSFRWLEAAGFIALFYAPIAVALAAFFTLAIDGRSPTGRRYAMRLDRRTALYQALEPPAEALEAREDPFEGAVWLKAIEKKSIYGIMASVAAWPVSEKSLSLPLLLGLYLFLAILFVYPFFRQNRSLRRRMKTAARRREAITDWLRTTAARPGAALLEAFATMGKVPYHALGELQGCGGRALYFDNPGRPSPGAPAPTPVPSLLLCLERDKTLDEATFEQVVDVARASSVRALYVLCSAPFPVSAATGTRLLRAANMEVSLLCWIDLDAMVLRAARQATTFDVLDAAQARTRALATKATLAEAPTPETPSELAARALPVLAYLLRTSARQRRVADVGAGCGRHTVLALQSGHHVCAIERKSGTAQVLQGYLESLEQKAECEVLVSDFRDLAPLPSGFDVVICTGVLQHARGAEDLRAQLACLRQMASGPGALVYIEMLFNMTFDGQPPSDGRMSIDMAEFEAMLGQEFSNEAWDVFRTHGPLFQRQDFTLGRRSFAPPANVIESTAVEYAIVNKT